MDSRQLPRVFLEWDMGKSRRHERQEEGQAEIQVQASKGTCAAIEKQLLTKTLQFLRKQPKAANLRNKKRLFTQPNS
jgi:hypothetical protein